MKEKLIRVYQLLNILSVSGHQNILALGESIGTIQNIINDISAEEELKSQQNQPIKIDNTGTQNTKNEKKGDKT